ncbi:MAG TPA: glycosyltransferase family 4 protein [Armatimonadota bacterium]|nr:glycosyltransferase family 4 protein [Armatimonadota bacterium]
MRLGILTQYYPPEMGAPQARLSEIAARFVRKGHEVVVLTAMPNYPTGRIFSGYGGFYRRETMDGVKVIRSFIYPTKQVGLLPRLANYFSFVLSSLLVGAAVLPPLDFLLTESPPLFLGMSGYLLSRAKRARWIFNVSDLWPESAVRLGIIGEGWPLRIACALERFCYQHAWLVTCQSHEILANIRERFPGVRAHRLSNGVDTSFFTPEKRSDVRRRELADEAPCVAIYTGLHGVAQGLEQVLQAAALLRDRNDIEIVLVGDGPTKEALRIQAKSLGLTAIRFLPPCARDTMPETVASADIAIVPLKGAIPGAVPSKLYEAMSAGRPVVLAAEGEPAGIVRDTGCGIVVAPGDTAALAGAILRLADDPQERARMGARGREAARARFDRQAIVNEFMELLERELQSSETRQGPP